METIKYLGLDVHKDSITIAAISGRNIEPDFMKTIQNKQSKLRKFFMDLSEKFEIITCYEAGCCGFGLQRLLSEIGVDCKVAAPGKIPRRSSDRIKTDPRDALNLAKLLRAGDIESIYIPTTEDESVRDYIRARDDIKKELKRNKQRLSQFLLRNGFIFEGTKWTQAHEKWLKTLSFNYLGLKRTYETYYYQISDLKVKVQEMDKNIEKMGQEGSYKDQVAKLRCFKGIDYLTALSLVSEIGDFRRFPKAESFMAFLGLVPGEHSSGPKRKQTGITKTGNSHLRRLLIESSWNYRFPPTVSKKLTERRYGQEEKYVQYANKAMKRLSSKYRKLVYRKKPQNTAVTAVARELAGFIWGMMVEKIA